jgi:hypothetical protein
VYLCAPFELLSYVTLHLEAGAVLQATARLEDYPIEANSGSKESNRAGLITAQGAENVSIVGHGTICGNGLAFIDRDAIKIGQDYDTHFVRQGASYLGPEFGTDDSSRAHGERPGNLLRFFECKRVRIQGVTICDSPTWTIHFRQCRNVDVDGAWIHSHGSGRLVPNDDGIDIWDCQGVRIHDCQIETGDDCVAIFGGEHILVTGCTLSAKSSGIRVGYTGSPIRNAVFSNLVIHDANRGIGVFVRGENSVENLLFSNIIIRTRHYTGHWWGAGEPIHVSAIALEHGIKLGRIRNVCFQNIRIEAESGIVLYGSEASPLQELELDNVRLNIRRGPLQDAYGGNIDLRATADRATSLFQRDIPGLYSRFTEHLTIRNLNLQWEEGLPAFFGKAIECEQFQDLEIDGFRGSTAHSDRAEAAISLRDGVGANLRNCRVDASSAILLAHERVTDLRQW